MNGVSGQVSSILILFGMIINKCLNNCVLCLGLSAAASLLSLAWSLAAYTRAQRRARVDKNKTSWPGLILQAAWRTGMLTARISTLVLFAYCFGFWIFLFIGLC